MGLDRETAIIKTTSPIKLAQEARKICKSSAIIAAGIGPLSDRPMGCFYPDYLNELTMNEIMEWHEERFKLYVDSECDILAIETIPGIKEIEALLNLLTKYPKDAYLSLACCFHGDKRLNSGEKWEHALQVIKEKGTV